MYVDVFYNCMLKFGLFMVLYLFCQMPKCKNCYQNNIRIVNVNNMLSICSNFSSKSLVLTFN